MIDSYQVVIQNPGAHCHLMILIPCRPPVVVTMAVLKYFKRSSSGVEQQYSEGWVHGTGGVVRVGNRLPRPSEASAAEEGRERGGRDARIHQSEGRHVYSADRHLTRAVTWMFYQNMTCDIIQAPAPENYLHVFLRQMLACYWRDMSRLLLDRLNATSSYFNPNPKRFF